MWYKMFFSSYSIVILTFYDVNSSCNRQLIEFGDIFTVMYQEESIFAIKLKSLVDFRPLNGGLTFGFTQHYALQYPHWFDINLANILWKHWQFIRAHGSDTLININESKFPACLRNVFAHYIKQIINPHHAIPISTKFATFFRN